MKLFCKSIGAGMILLAAAGCAGEDQSASAPQSTQAAKPSAPPNAQASPAGGGMSVEMQPPGFAGAGAAAATKGEPNAGGGPRIEGPKVDGDQAAAGAGALSAEQLTAIKELPASEQQAAIKQVSCPVSGEPLGSMGKPWKVSAEGRSFYLCCKGCEKDVKADPKGILAKLDQKKP